MGLNSLTIDNSLMTAELSEKHLNHRRNDIDGLRAVAILSVLAFHGWPDLLQGGFTGVDVFFVISGYLITSKITKDIEANQFSLVNFFANRTKRLFMPSLIVMTTTLLAGYLVLLPHEFKDLCKQSLAALTFTSNYYYWSEVGYFDVASELKPLLHFWSLGIEEQFYIAWPLLLVLAYRQKLSIQSLALAILTCSFFASVICTYYSQSTAFYWLPTRMWELMLGALLFFTSKASAKQRSSIWHLGRHSIWKPISGLFLITVSMIFSERRYFPGFFALLPTIGTALIIASQSNSWINSRLLSSRPLVFVGKISYSLYLWHWPLLSLLQIMEHKPSTKLRFAAVAISFLLALATYLGVERPLSKIRYDFRDRKPALTNLKFFSLSTIILSLICGALITEDISLTKMNERKGLSNDLTNNSAKILEHNGAINPGASIAIIGDSHAMQYAEAAQLLDLNPSIGIPITESSVPPLTGILFRQVDESKDNLKFEQALPSLLETKSVEYIALAARLSGYQSMSGNRFEGYPRYNLQFLLEGKSIGPDEGLYIGYSNTIRLILESGKQPIILMQAPEINYEPGHCLRPFTFSAERKCKNTTAAEVNRRFAGGRRIIDRLRAKFPNLWVYEPAQALCDNDTCFIKLNGRIMYSDDDHLSTTGAMHVLREFLTWINIKSSLE